MASSEIARLTFRDRLQLQARRLGPGIGLSATLALVSYGLEPLLATWVMAPIGWSYRLPAIVIALVIGIALNPLAARPLFEPGMTWCVKKLLRVAIALLGLRIALSSPTR